MEISFCFQMQFLGVITVSTRQPNELISAEEELDANQVKAKCRYWRKVTKTSERIGRRNWKKRIIYMTAPL